jgi:hypothetical protein
VLVVPEGSSAEVQQGSLMTVLDVIWLILLVSLLLSGYILLVSFLFAGY